jgi:hypothetical protein
VIFSPAKTGPAFNVKVAIENTELASMNDILRAYGRFDVAAGQFSVFSEISIKDGDMGGYVKPMFSNLEVYDYQKDKNTGVLHQAKELAIGGASHLFKNPNTQRVASEIDLKGKLTRPDVSTWQAIGQVLHNRLSRRYSSDSNWRQVQRRRSTLPSRPNDRTSCRARPPADRISRK